LSEDYEKTGYTTLSRHLLPDVVRPCWSEDEESRLRTGQGFVESPKEAAERNEEVLEEAKEGAEQDVQEQPEKYALSQETVLTSGAESPASLFQNLERHR
jgi:hypothetical protein